MSEGRWFLVASAATAAAAWAGVAFGLWWAAFPAGLVIGLAVPQARAAIAAGALGGLIGWALPLALMNARIGLGPTADSLAAIMGFPKAQSAIPVVLTCAVGLLLGLCGAWLGSAVRSFLRAVPGWPRRGLTKESREAPTVW